MADTAATTTDAVLERALALAVRAPSAHNTQPWRFRKSGATVDLFVDTDVALRNADPDGRDATLGLGAVLHHLRLALAVEGRHCEIRRFPRTFDPDHVARIDFAAPHTPTDDEAALAEAIGRRRTDRRGYDDRVLSSEQRNDLIARAARYDVHAHLVTDAERRACLSAAARRAADVHAKDRAYQLELAAWSGLRGSDEGVPLPNVVRPDPDSELPARAYAGSALDAATGRGVTGDLILIASAVDDRAAQLRAGEAASEILLAATSVGLSTCPVTEPLEIAWLRDEIRQSVLDGGAFPQIILRVGWPMTGAPPVPVSPRRPIEDTLVDDIR
ncbi:nitroreductase family protein [Gordonia sp. PKS22-38]|uniref:Nitroreductase family protein n=1 Tax=Gordonia prachuapensis TaxID=3115651 RepID=A0ABU7MWD6_9ACTN|nr:nitroreductase family protein [Gordonia sp. PKS22-38]